MRPLNRASAIVLLLAAAACTDRESPVVTPPTPEPPKEAPRAIGTYTLEVTGIGTDHMSSRLVASTPASTGARGVLTNAGGGLVFENVSATAFNEGSAASGGERYISFVYRVRNGTGVALNNVTLLLVQTSSPRVTIAGSPLSSLKRRDGTNANASIAPQIVPTGAVALGEDLVSVKGLYPDVIQVYTEPEVAAITKPAGVTDIFPVGYMVRSKNTNANRTLPVATDPNQYDGLVTAAFRMPQQPTAAEDVGSLFFEILAVTDSETKITESIEESQDTAAVRRLRDRATALGATTTTVLNGSSAMDPAVADYPGQRQICSPRTAGPAGAAVTTMVKPAAYSSVMVLTTGETVDPDKCAAYFRSGTASRPPTNVPFKITVKAMDRYGNVKTTQVDTFRLVETNGVPATVTPAAGLVSGSADIYVTYSDYGNSILRAQGRRLHGHRPIPVAGVLRYWTAGAGTTNWHTNANWSPQAVPMSQDSVLIPLSAPLDPVLAANVTVRGVTVEDGATISLTAFDLTAHANVFAGLSGGITNTSGRLFLSGTAMTVQGVVPTLRVNGTYSLSGNVNARAPITVEAGRLTVSGLRLQASSQ